MVAAGNRKHKANNATDRRSIRRPPVPPRTVLQLKLHDSSPDVAHSYDSASGLRIYAHKDNGPE